MSAGKLATLLPWVLRCSKVHADVGARCATPCPEWHSASSLATPTLPMMEPAAALDTKSLA